MYVYTLSSIYITSAKRYLIGLDNWCECANIFIYYDNGKNISINKYFTTLIMF
jgi:hypothetical protein